MAGLWGKLILKAGFVGCIIGKKIVKTDMELHISKENRYEK